MTVLSVLDLATVAQGTTAADALADTTRVAVEVERLGYHRLWVAEHHGMPSVASSAPAVLIAHLAAATTTLRVGAGGVMLPNHSPLVIAEQFATLEALHPGRIDLGLGRAPGTDPATARALRRDGDLAAERFPEDVVELLNYLIDHDGPATVPAPMPGRGYLPEVWILGSSTFGAQLAGLLGLPFAFAYHFAPDQVDAAVATYRQHYRPTGLSAGPHLAIGVSVLCAASDEEATFLAGPSALAMLNLRSGRPAPVVTPDEAAAYPYTDAERAAAAAMASTHVVGSPETVQRGLDALVARTGADELILSTRAHALSTRLDSLTRVAELRELAPAA